MKKQVILSALIGLVFSLSTFTQAATYGGGSGTLTDPYQIWTPEQMNTIGVNPADWGKSFTLMANIDMSAYTGTQYNIIGATWENPFTGTFDGNGYVIHNLTYTTNDAVDLVGLFGFIQNATIMNISVENVNLSTGGRYVGGVVGYQNYGTTTHCSSTGSVTSLTMDYSSTGGFVGGQTYGTITHCFSSNSVTISSTYSYAGGFVGILNGGTITYCYSTGAVNAYSYPSYPSFTGGLVGIQTFGTIANCYSTSIVSSSSPSNSVHAGGLVGFQDNDSNAKIENCYSTGPVSATGSTVDKGGLLGYKSGTKGLITACFWDKETSGQSYGLGYGSSRGVFGKTTAEMKTPSTFISAGWDFTYSDGDTTDWFMPEADYPHLTCEITVTIPSVVGQTLTNAKTALTEAILDIAVTLVVSDVIPAGHVVSQSPAAGLLVDGGTTVNLVVSNGKPYSGGSGTESDPFQIATREDLMTLSIDTANYNKCFIMTSDIDMAPTAFSAALIARDMDYSTLEFEGTAFTGLFNGNGHKITNFTIAGGSNDYLGLFGYTENAIIRNLGIENLNISAGGDYVGGLVGEQISGTMADCYSTGSVRSFSNSSFSYVGGLVGCSSADITNCYSTGSVSASAGYDLHAGGLVGYSSGTITHCYSRSSVGSSFYNASQVIEQNSGIANYDDKMDPIPASSSYIIIISFYYPYTGGLVGGASGTITDCYSTGPVSSYYCAGGLVGTSSAAIADCYSTASVTCESGNSSYAGGLVGRQGSDIFQPNANNTITRCYSTGTVVSSSPGFSSSYAFAGGLVGSQDTGTIVHCYSMSSVTAFVSSFDESSISSAYAGGLVGSQDDYSVATIEKCYSTGLVSATGDIGDDIYSGDYIYKGGLLGYKGQNEGTITACFWDTQTSGTSDGVGNTDPAGVIGKTTTQLQKRVTYLLYGWDFVGEAGNGTNDIWTLCEGTNYPKFVWQVPAADWFCPDGVGPDELLYFSYYWLAANCASQANCDGVDLNHSGTVDLADWVIFAEQWLEGS